MAILEKINDIENAPENLISEIAEEKTAYKGYDIYLADLEGYFGYSALVYKNGKHIYWTNDYELHHKGRTHEELKKMYLDGMKYKLFTAEDMNTVVDYDDYERKFHWILSYYPQEYDYESAFVISGTKKEKRLEALLKERKMYFSRVCCCYFYEEEPARQATKLYKALDEANEKAKDFDYWVSAFEKELYNHEYLINWQGNWDVFSCFGNVEYKGDVLGESAEIEDYCKQLGFTDMHRKAFKEAYSRYYEVAKDY